MPRRGKTRGADDQGSVVASDAFFPFADGLLVAIDAGATAVIQPGGSMRDDEVIKAAMSTALPWCSLGCGISDIEFVIPGRASWREPRNPDVGVRCWIPGSLAKRRAPRNDG